MRKAAAAIALALVVTACSSSELGTVTMEERVAAVSALVEEVYLPGYGGLAQQAKELLGAVEAFCDGSGTLEQARAEWNDTMSAWFQTASFRFGPARSLRLGNSVSYPIDEVKVTEAFATAEAPDDVARLGSDVRGLGGPHRERMVRARWLRK